MTSVFNRILLLVSTAGLALACQTQEPATEQGSETDPAADAAAIGDAIRAKDRAFADALVAKDVETMVSQYAPDAILLPPGNPKVEGAQAIRDIFTTWFAQEGGPSAATLTSDAITVSSAGDYAHSVGSFTMSGTAPDGSEYTDQGKYVAVWKSIDGDWKMTADIWNSDAPPPGMDEGMPEAETAPAE
jgi:ketosteroid isomerase-like protein